MAELTAGKGNGQVARGARHKRLLSEAIQLEEEVVPQFIKPALLAIAVLVVMFVVWASIVPITEVTTAPGEVVPSASVKVVEHLEGGSVAEVMVEEGKTVEKGEPLIRVDGGQVDSELTQMEARYVALRLRGERLAAFAEGREPDFGEFRARYPELVADQEEIFINQLQSRETGRSVIRAQLEQRRRSLEQQYAAMTIAEQQQVLTTEMLAMRQRMVDRKLISKVEFLETKRAKVTADGEIARLTNEIAVMTQSIEETQSELANLDAQLRQEATTEMGTVSAEIAEVQSAIRRLRERVKHLLVRSPARGLVQDLKIKNVGQVIRPGEVVMEIVPVDDVLEAEVKIRTEDIGHAEVGQRVLVKVGTYQYTRFGGVDGTLRRISASSHLERDGSAYFKGRVKLDRPYVGMEPGKYKVLPGMSVEADILTGEKTLLQYLLKPVFDAVNRSFTER